MPSPPTLNNTCYVSYGDKNAANNKTPTSEADVYEAKFTVTKKDGDNQPLEGAGFVIKNADGKYYVDSWHSCDGSGRNGRRRGL